MKLQLSCRLRDYNIIKSINITVSSSYKSLNIFNKIESEIKATELNTED